MVYLYHWRSVVTHRNMQHVVPWWSKFNISSSIFTQSHKHNGNNGKWRWWSATATQHGQLMMTPVSCRCSGGVSAAATPRRTTLHWLLSAILAHICRAFCPPVCSSLCVVDTSSTLTMPSSLSVRLSVSSPPTSQCLIDTTPARQLNNSQQ